jgi:hypothetical protein
MGPCVLPDPKGAPAMKRPHYYTAPAELAPRPTPAPGPRTPTDITRLHASNWGAAVGILALCLGLGAWLAAKAWGAPVTVWQLVLTPAAAILAAGVAYSVKLLEFTGQHRQWLYGLEDLTGQDLDGDGITGDPARGRPQEPRPGALVRGVDGALHRIDTTLAPHELQAVKRHLLTAGAFTVRAVNDLLGDDSRASALRVELHRLGILEPPRDRAATRLTEPGRKAVMRWG